MCCQVEYCFTGEGSDSAPAPLSLRGLDAGVYYRAGSLLNCGHAAVRSLVLDSLRHWALHYDVDGFCFVNAETMAQGEHPCPYPIRHPRIGYVSIYVSPFQIQQSYMDQACLLHGP